MPNLRLGRLQDVGAESTTKKANRSNKTKEDDVHPTTN